jgi:hypothetical protein
MFILVTVILLYLFMRANAENRTPENRDLVIYSTKSLLPVYKKSRDGDIVSNNYENLLLLAVIATIGLWGLAITMSIE